LNFSINDKTGERKAEIPTTLSIQQPNLIVSKNGTIRVEYTDKSGKGNSMALTGTKGWWNGKKSILVSGKAALNLEEAAHTPDHSMPVEVLPITGMSSLLKQANKKFGSHSAYANLEGVNGELNDNGIAHLSGIEVQLSRAGNIFTRRFNRNITLNITPYDVKYFTPEYKTWVNQAYLRRLLVLGSSEIEPEKRLERYQKMREQALSFTSLMQEDVYYGDNWSTPAQKELSEKRATALLSQDGTFYNWERELAQASIGLSIQGKTESFPEMHRQAFARFANVFGMLGVYINPQAWAKAIETANVFVQEVIDRLSRDKKEFAARIKKFGKERASRGFWSSHQRSLLPVALLSQIKDEDLQNLDKYDFEVEFALPELMTQKDMGRLQTSSPVLGEDGRYKVKIQVSALNLGWNDHNTNKLGDKTLLDFDTGHELDHIGLTSTGIKGLGMNDYHALNEIAAQYTKLRTFVKDLKWNRHDTTPYTNVLSPILGVSSNPWIGYFQAKYYSLNPTALAKQLYRRYEAMHREQVHRRLRL